MGGDMRKLLFLVPVAVLTLTGCKALDSLIFHPVAVAWGYHENNEAAKAEQRYEASTNEVTHPK